MHLTGIVIDSTSSASHGGDGSSSNDSLPAEARSALRLALRTLTLFFLQYAFGPATDREVDDFEDWATLWLFVYAAAFFATGLLVLAAVFAVLSKIFHPAAAGRGTTNAFSPRSRLASDDDDSSRKENTTSSSSSSNNNNNNKFFVAPLPVVSGFELLPQHPAATAVALLADAAVCGWVSSRSVLFFWACAELGFDIVLAVSLRIRQYRSTRLILQAVRAPIVVVSSALVSICVAAALLCSFEWESSSGSGTGRGDGFAAAIIRKPKHGSWEPFFDFASSLFFLVAARSLLWKSVIAERFGDVFNVVMSASASNVSERGGGASKRRHHSSASPYPAALQYGFVSFGTDMQATIWKLLTGAARTALLAVAAMFLSKMVRLNGSTTDTLFDIIEFAVSDLIISPRFTLAVFWIMVLVPVVVGVVFSASCCRSSHSGSAHEVQLSHFVAFVPFVEIMKGASSSRYDASSRNRSAVGLCATAVALCAVPLSLSCALWSSSAATSSSTVSDLLFSAATAAISDGANESRVLRLFRFFIAQTIAVWIVFFVVKPGSVLMAFLWTLVGVTMCSGLLTLSPAFSGVAPFTESFTTLIREIRAAGGASGRKSDDSGSEDASRSSSWQLDQDPLTSSSSSATAAMKSSSAGSAAAAAAAISSTSSSSSFTALISAIWDDSHERRLLIFFLFTASFMFVEFFVGAAGDSLGLISDAFHMLVDATSIFIGLAAAHAARWKPTPSHPFGFSRYEAMSGLFNGILLVVVAVHISVEAFQRMKQERVVDSGKVLWVSIAGLLLNLVGVVFFHDWSGASTSASEPNTPVCRHCIAHRRTDVSTTSNTKTAPTARPSNFDEQHHHHDHHHGHSHDHEHSHHSSLVSAGADDFSTKSCPHREVPVASSHEANMRGVYLHVLADLLGSVAVVVSSVIINFTGMNIVDPICAIVVSLLILFASYSLLSATFETLTVAPKSLLTIISAP